MPLYDFECKACGRRFEELVFEGDGNPPCPGCGCTDVYQLPASPSPKPTNPFPYKVGPVNQAFVNNVKRIQSGQGPSCGGQCGTGACPHAQAASDD
ncbi:MAG: zinc ribbon domain-containing protein [Desulfovibrio sp.]|nr:zinc ribbon domain-containing protein [Desulfovibrio sp.]MCR5256583.1 zinc ribbon domain-containing protein [Desulfovibrio sp.]